MRPRVDWSEGRLTPVTFVLQSCISWRLHSISRRVPPNWGAYGDISHLNLHSLVVAQLGESLPSIYEALSLIPALCRLETRQKNFLNYWNLCSSVDDSWKGSPATGRKCTPHAMGDLGKIQFSLWINPRAGIWVLHSNPICSVNVSSLLRKPAASQWAPHKMAKILIENWAFQSSGIFKSNGLDG